MFKSTHMSWKRDHWLAASHRSSRYKLLWRCQCFQGNRFGASDLQQWFGLGLYLSHENANVLGYKVYMVVTFKLYQKLKYLFHYFGVFKASVNNSKGRSKLIVIVSPSISFRSGHLGYVYHKQKDSADFCKGDPVWTLCSGSLSLWTKFFIAENLFFSTGLRPEKKQKQHKKIYTFLCTK